jgi:NarL family two-component system response regulator LiaR
MSATRAVIVEDHALIRTALRIALQEIGVDVVGEADDGVIGHSVIKETKPDVAIIDVGLPGKDGVALTREVKAMTAAPSVVILTMREEDDWVFAALAAGAEGYCVKSSGTDIVMDAVRTVAQGGAYFDPRIAHVVLRRFSGAPSATANSPLTNRETEIVQLMADGVSNAEIAERLHVSYSTVKTHVAEILRKLAASDRGHAATIAVRRGLIP